MTISKGWVFIFGVIAGIIIGLSDAGPELESVYDSLKASAGTLAKTAGRGASDVGGFVQE